MSILDANADSLRATALNSYSGPSKPPEPGVFSNFLPGAGSYFMRGMAESGRALSMAGAAVPVIADKLIGSDNRGESYGDRYFRWHDEVFGSAVDYWTPKPGEVGAAGQVVGSLAAGLVQFLANPALLIGTAQLSTAEDLVRQGVDAGAANVAGDVAGLSTLAGIALPIFGKTLAGRIATGAAGNFATNIPEAAIKRAVVESAGSPAAAAQFDPWDVRARTVDVLMGVAFGAKSHFDARSAAKTQAFLEGDIPSQRTAIADAAAQAVDAPMTATQRDAIMVMNAARHLDEVALPWRAGEAEHTAAVDNVRLAVEQISRGQEVDVPPVSPPSDAVPKIAPDIAAPNNAKSAGLSGVLDAWKERGIDANATEAEGRTVSEQDKTAVDLLTRTRGAQFPDDLRLPTGEFDPATGAQKTISANEYVAKAAADAEHVKATAEGLMRTVATCILGGI